MATRPALSRFKAMKKKRSARVIPKKPETASNSQSLTGLSGKKGISKINMVRETRINATKLLYKLRETGEKSSPLFLNKITALAQKKAAHRDKIAPSIVISLDPYTGVFLLDGAVLFFHP